MLEGLKKKEKELELAKVKCGLQEFELKILQRLEEIERIKGNIEVQKNRIEELEIEIKGDDK